MVQVKELVDKKSGRLYGGRYQEEAQSMANFMAWSSKAQILVSDMINKMSLVNIHIS